MTHCVAELKLKLKMKSKDNIYIHSYIYYLTAYQSNIKY